MTDLDAARERHAMYALDPSVMRGYDDPRWCASCDVPWPCDFDKMRALADELAEAGHHDKRCDVSTVAWSSEGIRCTCGWDAALAKWEASR